MVTKELSQLISDKMRNKVDVLLTIGIVLALLVAILIVTGLLPIF